MPAIPHIGKGKEEDSAHADDLAHSFYAGLELEALAFRKHEAVGNRIERKNLLFECNSLYEYHRISG